MLQFEKNAEKYEKIRAKIAYPAELYEYLVSLCDNHDAALDIGCGNGVSTVRLQPFFKTVKGIDLGENLIKLARKSYPDLSFEVMRAEEIQPESNYNLITSATSFYWMDRPYLIAKLQDLLSAGGVFCAYKYDFPIPYGNLRDFINYELSTKWAPYRDSRLVNYDDTLELLNQVGTFTQTGRFLISNIIELTPEEVAYFFLSTSYVTTYMEKNAAPEYCDWFLKKCQTLEPNKLVKINFDIHAFYAKK